MAITWKDVETALPGGLKLLGAALSATGVGAPVGAAVAGIGALVGHALGVDGSSPDAVLAAVQTDPAAAAKLLEVQENAKVQLQQLVAQQAVAQMQNETAQQAAQLADVASARSRDVEVRRADGGKNARADLMVALDVSGLVVCIVGAVVMKLCGDLDVASATLLTTFASYFGLSLRDAHAFEFGSSRSSQNKDATIQQAMSQVAGGAAAAKP
jgi:hypothetical protein